MVVLQIDSDGSGKRDAAVERDQPVDPQKDKRIPGGFYAIKPSPVDCERSTLGSVPDLSGRAAILTVMCREARRGRLPPSLPDLTAAPSAG